MRPLSRREIQEFQTLIYRYYRDHGRRLPWRETRDPYRIAVSEIMLQQTQVERVLEKYGEFLARFPDIPALAGAPWPDVLAAWQGLGYNRRALALKRLAGMVMERWQGRLPATLPELRSLPGVGPATAGAILAFAFEEPVVFLETNIRRVFLHCFFPHQEGVRDRELLPLVAQTLDRKNVRHWYYALMDYGAGLKKGGGNPNRRSAHYARQTPFAGSLRQLRGLILKTLLREGSRSLPELQERLVCAPDRLAKALADLVAEGFLVNEGGRFSVPSRL